MSVTSDYVEAVLRRAREPLEPADFTPNWNDRPYRTKRYPGADRIALPEAPQPTGTLGASLAAAGAPAVPFDLASLSAMLRCSYGLGARRARLTGNEDSPMLAWFEHASWARGTASGGGLYSAEIYWVAGASGPLLPGVYHYSHPHHALNRLLVGDVVDQVRAATPGRDADHYLLVSVKIWKNSFKYNSFSYHVVTMDVGTLLGTWGIWSAATGRRIEPVWWFDERSLDELLGLDCVQESVLAVVPLPWVGAPEAGAVPAALERPSSQVRVRRREVERSREVIRFPRVEAVHRACLDEGLTPPSAAELAAAFPHPRSRGPAVQLPEPEPSALDVGVDQALRSRRSSFGGFSATPPLTGAALSGILAYAAAAGGIAAEVTDGLAQVLTRCVVFATHVEGVEEGLYEYDAGLLRVLEQAPVGRFLQWSYFLSNYNLEQAAATIGVLGRPRAVIDAVGDRGYRLLNAEVGAVAQAVYVAAAAAGVGCGAVLGFDNVAVAERLGIVDTDEWPLLLIMIGTERPAAPDIDLRLD